MDRIARGRPTEGIGHYLRDVVYGASDGVVTTLAVIAGVAGAQLAAWTAVVLGVANLVADGLSMAVSNYLGLKSELEQDGRSVAEEQPWRHGLATFGAFVSVGSVPLTAFALAPSSVSPVAVAITSGLLALAIVGGLRARFVRRSRLRCAAEMVALAGSASAVAYGLGAALQTLSH